MNILIGPNCSIYFAMAGTCEHVRSSKTLALTRSPSLSLKLRFPEFNFARSLQQLQNLLEAQSLCHILCSFGKGIDTARIRSFLKKQLHKVDIVPSDGDVQRRYFETGI